MPSLERERDMGLISNKVDRSELQAGDHIYSYRKLHAYSHHGIYVEADRVIHYNRTRVAKKLWVPRSHCSNCGHHPNMARGVVKTCVDCFRAGHQLYRFQYGVSFGHYVVKLPGTCSTGRCASADLGIPRAVELLESKGFGDYNLFENNCEAFAIYCKTNKRMSEQAFAAISIAKHVVKGIVKHNVDRLLHDVLIHHPEKHMQLKQAIETLRALPFKEIIANLKRLNVNVNDDDQDVPEDHQDVHEDDQFEEYLETMEEEKVII